VEKHTVYARKEILLSARTVTVGSVKILNSTEKALKRHLDEFGESF
jgi:hypothetical protein